MTSGRLTTTSPPIATDPGHRAMPQSTVAATYQWTPDEKRDIIGGEFHAKKSEFSQYAEIAARFKGQLTDKAKDTRSKSEQ